jgi:excinuclease ABC subunit C
MGNARLAGYPAGRTRSANEPLGDVGEVAGFNSGMKSNAREQAARLPPAPGVYRFRDASGRVLYLGRATSLRRRAASYWGDLTDRPHLRLMVAKIARVEAVVCDSAHEAAWLERNLLQTQKPPWNRAPAGGQEIEVWIRLCVAPRSPGLTVVHRPRSGAEPASSPDVRHFGPYLGGRQARLAVSGLCRVLPLSYANGALTGARRDLARIRGVAEDDRAPLASTAAAVLSRDPAAVASLTASLTAFRDAASGALAFELAARLQQEIAALDWVTAEQKVTSQEATDHDVSGWSAGTLVRFAIRGGRLTGWSQRACGEAAASRHLAGTAPEWAAFAQRNAQLAARLSA